MYGSVEHKGPTQLTSPYASPTSTTEPNWFVFVSSLYLEHRALRERLYQLGTADRPIYVDEEWRKHSPGPHDPLLKADELLRRVRVSPVFICVLGGPRHGSAIPVAGIESNVSFFEIELYQAALLQKKIHVLKLQGFSPGPRLQSLLNILSFAMPPSSWIEVKDEADAVAAVKRIVDSEGRCAVTVPHLLKRLVTGFFRANGRLGSPATILGPGFLADSSDVTGGQPDMNLVRGQLQSAEVDQELQLARTWMAFRELMAVPWRLHRDDEIRRCWNEAYQRWAGAAAWYGVHCHQPLACLAALKSMSALREEVRKSKGGSRVVTEFEHPGCALGSAYYSLARLLLSRRDRLEHFRQAEAHLNRSMDLGEGDLAALLAVRGSVYRCTYRLPSAIRDYAEVLDFRKRQHTDAQSIGEAMTELGFGYCCIGRVWRGRRLMMDGISLLQSKESGFLVRALRKMEKVNLISGHMILAAQNREEAREIAGRLNLLDQMRQM